jgi:hypothetical protein
MATASKESYELSDARINDIIRKTFACAETALIAPIITPLEVAASEVVPAPISIACEKKMVKRISTIYQQMQPNTSIYKKYGGGSDDDDDDDDHENATGSGGIDAGACITKLSKSMLESIHAADAAPLPPPFTQKPKLISNYKFFPTPKMPGTGNMHNNQLLWCVYIAMNGRAAFDTMQNAFIAETEFKYATVDIMRIQKMRIKTLFKRYKLSMPNFEAELISSKKLDVSGMMALALCHNQNILYIDNRMYFEIIATTETDSITVIEKIKNRYCVYNNAASGTLQMCRDTFWKMESITAPLKSISHYKLAELQDIYARLGCSGLKTDGKKKVTKPELYAAIMLNVV